MIKRFLDTFRRKPAPVLNPLPKGSPRIQYYMFAHRLLPYLFFDKPDAFMKILRQPNGLDFLRFQWNNLAKHAETPEPPTALNYETRQLEDDTAVAIITLPTPKFVTEAYFTAAVYRPESKDKAPITRYFALEYGATFDPERPQHRTVLGEWTAQTQHFNYGDGCAPDSTAFLQSIREKLAQPVGTNMKARTDTENQDS